MLQGPEQIDHSNNSLPYRALATGNYSRAEVSTPRVKNKKTIIYAATQLGETRLMKFMNFHKPTFSSTFLYGSTTRSGKAIPAP